MDGLDDFLKGPAEEAEIEAPETPEVEAVETPPEEAPQGPTRDEKGRFASKGEQEAAAPAAEEPVTVPVKALQEERRKRQELEQRLADFEARQPQTPPPSMFDDEQGWQQHFGSQVVNTAVQQATFNARLDMSEMMVRQAHPDFEEKKAAFVELMNETPGLQQKALADPHPWNFAYNYVASHQRMQELSATNVAELEARLREKIKAELAAENPPPPPIPETLADSQSARGTSGESLHVPSFNEILKR